MLNGRTGQQSNEDQKNQYGEAFAAQVAGPQVLKIISLIKQVYGAYEPGLRGSKNFCDPMRLPKYKVNTKGQKQGTCSVCPV